MRKYLLFLTVQQWRWLALGFLLSFLCLLAAVGLLAVSGWLICAAAVAGLTVSSAIFFNYFIPAAIIRFFALVRIMARYGERIINHDTTLKILRDLRVYCYQKLEPLAPAHFYYYRSGDLLHRFISDIQMLDNLYLRIFSPLGTALLLTLVCTLLLHFFSATIAWLVFSSVIFSLLLCCFYSYVCGKSLGKKIMLCQTQLRLEIVTNLHGMMEILNFTASQLCLDKFKKIQRDWMQAQKKMSFYQGLSFAILLLFSALTVILVLWFGALLVMQHVITGAVLALMVLITIALYELMMPLPYAFQGLKQTEQAVNRVHDILQRQPTVHWANTSEQEISHHTITINDLTFFYPEQKKIIFQHFNLCVPAKSRLAITGNSGVGKTTLAQLLVRSWDPIAGEILIGDVKLQDLSEQQLRRTVVYAEQQAHIFNASLRENMLIGNNKATDTEIWEVLSWLELKSLAETLPEKLDVEMGEFGKRFSGGQIKRVSIARALLSSAPIVILDEPSEGIDADTFKRIWSTILENNKLRTFIVLTHQVKLFGDFDQVIAL